MNSPQYLETAYGAKIAYHKHEGKGPGVVFLGGFMSDMEGSKALALEAYCKRVGRAFLRFDYQGHGQSSGTFAEGTIGIWARDAMTVLDTLTEGPQILVGSSMGGWISMLVSKARPGRVKGFVGIAAAPDFTVRMWNEDFGDAEREEILAKGAFMRPCDYGDEPYTITKALIEDGWDNRVIAGPLKMDMPVRLIQGTEDADVPWQTAQMIADKLTSDDVEIILVPGGDHRLSTDQDLKRLIRIVDGLAAEI